MSKRDLLNNIWSMESDLIPDGIRKRELEYTFYGQVQNINDLKDKALKSEVHEQWLIRTQDIKGFKARIRSIDGTRFILTTKTKQDGQIGSLETECEISKDMFESLKLCATGGYKKTRYIYRCENPDLVWEIDVFTNQRGEIHDWVKIDLEVPNAEVELPKLPIPFLNVITHQAKEMEPDERTKVDTLWNKEWSCLDADKHSIVV